MVAAASGGPGSPSAFSLGVLGRSSARGGIVAGVADTETGSGEDVVEHAVIARYRMTGAGLGDEEDWGMVHECTRALRAAVEAAGVGEVDGDEFGGGEAVLYAYGPDADALFKVMEPGLRRLPLRPARIKLRYGSVHDPDVVERWIEL